MVENSGGWVSWVISKKMLVKCFSCTFLPAAETEVLTQMVIEDGRNGLVVEQKRKNDKICT